MKRSPTLMQRRAQRHMPLGRTTLASPRAADEETRFLLPEVDEGPEAPYRELIERIVRGERIRGHAL